MHSAVTKLEATVNVREDFLLSEYRARELKLDAPKSERPLGTKAKGEDSAQTSTLSPHYTGS